MRSGDKMMKIFPEALRVLQAIHFQEYGLDMRLACASSAVTPQAVQIAKAAMAMLEIVPGRFMSDFLNLWLTKSVVVINREYGVAFTVFDCQKHI